MGRETKILLGLLGTLAFVFLGALLAKLFIARPPEGTGVDVHADVARAEPHEIVEPPVPGRPAVSAFAAAAVSEPPSVSEPAAASDAPMASEAPTATASGVDREPGADREPAAVQASAARPAEAAAEATADRASFDEPVVQASFREPAGPAAIVPGSVRILEPGDTWWSIAEAAYGDGRFYRALYAWNRAIDPTTAAAPGRRIEVPTRDQLMAAHPAVVPVSRP